MARLRRQGAELVGEIAQYEDIYRLCFLRGPERIIIGLAEQLGWGLRRAASRRLSATGQTNALGAQGRSATVNGQDAPVDMDGVLESLPAWVKSG